MTIFVTGSTKGIGRAMALRFAAAGHNLVINGANDIEALNTLGLQIKEYGAACLPLFGDVSKYDTVKGFFSEIIARFGVIDAVINNAAISHIEFFADMKEPIWQRIIDVNLNGVINVCHAAIPYMLSQKNGHIINISSVWGEVGASCEAVYSLTKGGVDAFTKSLAKELGTCSIKVNAISCGVIDTAMNSSFSDDEKNELTKQILLGKTGTPDDVAKAAEFLLNSEYITGQILRLDGGFAV